MVRVRARVRARARVRVRVRARVRARVRCAHTLALYGAMKDLVSALPKPASSHSPKWRGATV